MIISSKRYLRVQLQCFNLPTYSLIGNLRHFYGKFSKIWKIKNYEKNQTRAYSSGHCSCKKILLNILIFRVVVNRVRWKHPVFTLAIRINVLKVISVAVHMFSAHRFRPMIKYAWYIAGFLQEKPNEFRTPVQFCFRDWKQTEQCACGLRGFLKCSQCENILCFSHAFIEVHNHCD